MSKGVLIHLDNDRKKILTPTETLFKQTGIDLKYLTCESKEEFEKIVNAHSGEIKALIFDLLDKDPKEGNGGKFDSPFLDDLRKGYADYNIPIFVYSGYLNALGNEFANCGTVFLFDKDGGAKPIFDKLKFLLDSGFVEVFCPGGVLETETKEELHKSFVNQFKSNDEIEAVINSIGANNPERVKKVFKRIAIKTLASDLLAPVADSKDKVNPIEHFYRRQSELKVWTGDVWKDNSAGNHVLVLTPRCDFAVGKAENVLFCMIDAAPKFPTDAKPDRLLKLLGNHLVDNIDGKAKRYIPATIFFPDGGMVNVSAHHVKPKNEFEKNFTYVVTLSDDLTNEIIGKFAYYFLRTGITNIDETEFEAIVKAMSAKDGTK